MSNSRLRYLCYRCMSCHRLITKLEIIARWEAAEASGKPAYALCVCGARKVNPTNPTPEEEEKLASDEQRARYESGIRDENTRLWELWDKEVKGKELGPEYEKVEV